MLSRGAFRAAIRLRISNFGPITSRSYRPSSPALFRHFAKSALSYQPTEGIRFIFGCICNITILWFAFRGLQDITNEPDFLRWLDHCQRVDTMYSLHDPSNPLAFVDYLLAIMSDDPTERGVKSACLKLLEMSSELEIDIKKELEELHRVVSELRGGRIYAARTAWEIRKRIIKRISRVEYRDPKRMDSFVAIG